jgi:NitT/TauT family transport system substrate-binding protein
MRKAIGAAALAAIVAMPAMPSSARAEASEIRFAKQFSMGYVQFNILDERKLVEKHAKAAGLGDVKVSWATFNGPNNMNEALLSNSVDIVAGGVPGLVTLWSKTRGTPQEVKGISALSEQPIWLNTRNPAVKTLKDFTDKDKIAVPAVKVSVQAVMLQMAAAKEWGDANYARLDPLTISMSPPDSTVAMLSNAGEITANFGVPPFQQQQLQNPAVRTILTSDDVMGGPHTFTCAWTSARFHDANPKLYGALVAALKEATEIIAADPPAAAAVWHTQAKSTMPLAIVQEVIGGKATKWTMVPDRTTQYAAFMVKTGAIKEPPKDWKELFFKEIHDLPGS